MLEVLAVPIARTRSFIGSTFVDKNDYPREAMVEAVLRFIEEDMDRFDIKQKQRAQERPR